MIFLQRGGRLTLNLAIFAVIALFCSYARAVMAPSPELLKAICEFHLLPTKKAAQLLDPYIQHLMNPSPNRMDPFLIDSSVVKTHQRYLSKGSFGEVSLVDTLEGPAAFKLYSNIELRDVAYGIRMQWLFGLLGLAPKVIGIMGPKELEALFRRQPMGLYSVGRMSAVSKNQFALLMENITPSWAVKLPQDLISVVRSTQFDIPAPLVRIQNQMRYQNIRAQLLTLSELFKALRIYAGDAQFLLSKDDRVVVHDLDFYHWFSPQGVRYGITPVAPENRWEYSEGILQSFIENPAFNDIIDSIDKHSKLP